MEFLATIIIPASIAGLQCRLTISELPHWCVSIEKVIGDAKSSGEIYSVWGTFLTHREDLRQGVCFSLPECPNGLQWTVSIGQPSSPLHTVIHVTINRAEHEQDFIDSIRQFVADWKAGLEAHW